MTLTRIQGQGHGGPKVAKMADFKGCLLRWYACNQKTHGELCYFKTISEFKPGRFLGRVGSRVHYFYKFPL